MPLTINTNLSSLIVQSNLKQSTNGLNRAIERMTTGFKINGAKDNAAGYSISTNMSSKISAYQVAEDNVSAGLDLLSTASGVLNQIDDYLARLRSLQVQASNGTYGEESLKAVNSEVNAIVDEITRLYATTEFNGKKLFIGTEEFEDCEDEVDTNIYVRDVDSFQHYTTYCIASTEDLVKLSNLVNNGVSTSYVYFKLTKDIDMSGVDFIAIGDETNKFMGKFDGQDHTIKNLKEESNTIHNGLFGYIANAEVKNVKLENVDLSNSHYAGGITGEAEKSVISNCHTSGNINVHATYSRAGGICAFLHDSSVYDCSSYCDIFSSAAGTKIGGIVGVAGGWNSPKIEDCYYSGTVKANVNNSDAGGIVGSMDMCSVLRCYAEGEVTAAHRVGGIAGDVNSSSNIDSCYANCKVIGLSYGNPKAGGLVGGILNPGNRISNSYATGSVYASGAYSYKAGLVGFVTQGVEIENCVSSAEMSQNLLNGLSNIVITNSDVRTLSEMQTQSIMEGYGFTEANGWYYETGKTPQLLKFKPPEEEPEDVLMNKQATVLQVGINSSESSTIRFNTSFDLTGLKDLRQIALNEINYISNIDELLLRVNSKQTELGAVQNRLESALEEISTHYENLLSSRSTLRDADVAKESSAYIRNQILQQASATLLATANQTPALALQLL